MTRGKRNDSGDGKPARRTDVGHGRPPREHQFKKGICPNPSGRRGKKVEPVNNPIMPSSIQEELLRLANSPMGESDDGPTSKFQYLVRSMFASSKQKPEIAKRLMQDILDAGRDEAGWRAIVLREALAHKEEWGSRFAQARLLGRPEPAVYPHPDDIIIHASGRVAFAGPITADEARKLNDLIEARDRLFEAVTFVMNEWFGDPEILHPIWLKARRQFYRVNPQIPKRLKKPFPRFEPGPEILAR